MLTKGTSSKVTKATSGVADKMPTSKVSTKSGESDSGEKGNMQLRARKVESSKEAPSKWALAMGALVTEGAKEKVADNANASLMEQSALSSNEPASSPATSAAAPVGNAKVQEISFPPQEAPAPIEQAKEPVVEEASKVVVVLPSSGSQQESGEQAVVSKEPVVAEAEVSVPELLSNCSQQNISGQAVGSEEQAVVSKEAAAAAEAEGEQLSDGSQQNISGKAVVGEVQAVVSAVVIGGPTVANSETLPSPTTKVNISTEGIDEPSVMGYSAQYFNWCRTEVAESKAGTSSLKNGERRITVITVREKKGEKHMEVDTTSQVGSNEQSSEVQTFFSGQEATSTRSTESTVTTTRQGNTITCNTHYRVEENGRTTHRMSATSRQLHVKVVQKAKATVSNDNNAPTTKTATAGQPASNNTATKPANSTQARSAPAHIQPQSQSQRPRQQQQANSSAAASDDHEGGWHKPTFVVRKERQAQWKQLIVKPWLKGAAFNPTASGIRVHKYKNGEYRAVVCAKCGGNHYRYECGGEGAPAAPANAVRVVVARERNTQPSSLTSVAARQQLTAGTMPSYARAAAGPRPGAPTPASQQRPQLQPSHPQQQQPHPSLEEFTRVMREFLAHLEGTPNSNLPSGQQQLAASG